jgi:hypothetical protein
VRGANGFHPEAFAGINSCAAAQETAASKSTRQRENMEES